MPILFIVCYRQQGRKEERGKGRKRRKERTKKQRKRKNKVGISPYGCFSGSFYSQSSFLSGPSESDPSLQRQLWPASFTAHTHYLPCHTPPQQWSYCFSFITKSCLRGFPSVTLRCYNQNQVLNSDSADLRGRRFSVAGWGLLHTGH